MTLNPFAGSTGTIAASQTPWWSGVGSALSNNSNLLLGLGGGLLSGNLGNIPQAIAAGSNADRSQKLQNYQLSLAAAQRNAADDYVIKLGHPELKGAFASVGDAIAANKPNVIAPGSTATTGFGDPIAGGNPGGFAGTGMDAQNWNTVMAAQSGRLSWDDPKAQAAWAQITQPVTTYQQTPQGVVPIMKQPNIPPGWGPPSGAPAAPSPGPTATPITDASGPTMPASGAALGQDTAPIGSFGGGGISVGTPLVGTRPQQQETMVRNQELATIAAPDLSVLHQTFGALAQPKNQIAGKAGVLGSFFTSQDYKRGSAALQNIIKMGMYSVSGAGTNPAEAVGLIDSMTPRINDGPEVVADKLARVDNFVKAMAAASGSPDAKAMVAAAIQTAKTPGTGIGAPQQQQPAASKVINGVTYTKDANGDWYKQ